MTLEEKTIPQLYLLEDSSILDANLATRLTVHKAQASSETTFAGNWKVVGQAFFLDRDGSFCHPSSVICNVRTRISSSSERYIRSMPLLF